MTRGLTLPLPRSFLLQPFTIIGGGRVGEAIAEMGTGQDVSGGCVLAGGFIWSLGSK